MRLLVARGGSELLGMWVAAGSRLGTPGWWGEEGESGEGREVRGGWGWGGWEHLVWLGCQGWLGWGSVGGCCWIPAGDAGMAEVGCCSRGVWFDTGLRETPTRFTTNGWGLVARKRPVRNRPVRQRAHDRKTGGSQTRPYEGWGR